VAIGPRSDHAGFSLEEADLVPPPQSLRSSAGRPHLPVGKLFPSFQRNAEVSSGRALPPSVYLEIAIT